MTFHLTQGHRKEIGSCPAMKACTKYKYDVHDPAVHLHAVKRCTFFCNNYDCDFIIASCFTSTLVAICEVAIVHMHGGTGTPTMILCNDNESLNGGPAKTRPARPASTPM